MNKFFYILIGLILTSSLVFSFAFIDKIRLVKNLPYVPSPINPNLHEAYIEKNYVKLINEDKSISFVKVVN